MFRFIRVSVLLFASIILLTGCGKKKETVEASKPAEKEQAKVEEVEEAKNPGKERLEKVKAAIAEAEAKGIDRKNMTIRSVKGSDKIEVVEIPTLLPSTQTTHAGRLEKDYLIKLQEKGKVHKEKQTNLGKARAAVRNREQEIKSSNPQYKKLVDDIEKLTAQLAEKQKQRDEILINDEQLEGLKVEMESVAAEAHDARMNLYAVINARNAEKRQKALEEKQRNKDATSEKDEFRLK